MTTSAREADSGPAAGGGGRTVGRVERSADLRTAAGVFARQRSPRLLAAGLSGTVAARLLWDDWSPADLAVAGALVAAQPFTEWVIHRYVLHVRPRGPVTRALDAAAGWSHRKHHEDPQDLRFQFIHPRAVVVGMVLEGALAATGPRAATGAVTAAALTLTYEWVHYLIHTDVPPRSVLYRRLHRNHRLHHFRNERYWLGVTGLLGDRVLATRPAKLDVPVSETARTAAAGLSR